MEKSYSDFIEIMGSPIYHEPVSGEIIEKYQNIIRGPQDEKDILIDLWRDIGFSGYEKGLFWIVNPNLYDEIIKEFEEISNTAIVFARTATGNLFLWEWIDIAKRPNIVHFNVHTRKRTFQSNSLNVFFNFDITCDMIWEEEFYGEMEHAALDKFGSIADDEAVVFVPALVLGGNEDVGNMQIQKLMTHLYLLSQL